MQTVTVTIYPDGETTVVAPDDVRVEIVYGITDEQRHCLCGAVIELNDDEEWEHVEGPHIWGGDHDAVPTGEDAPREPTADDRHDNG